jgi:hypothetical protein
VTAVEINAIETTVNYYLEGVNPEERTWFAFKNRKVTGTRIRIINHGYAHELVV